MRVALDLDQTIWPFVDTLQGLTPHDVSGYPGPNALENALGSLEAMHALFDECFTYESQTRAGLYPGAVEALRRLEAEGVEFYVITHRDAKYQDDSIRMLTEAGVPFVEFHAGPTLDKVALCAELGIEVIIDDHPHVIANAAETEGLRPVAMRHPYNADVIDRHNVDHADSWADLEALVLASPSCARASGRGE